MACGRKKKREEKEEDKKRRRKGIGKSQKRGNDMHYVIQENKVICGVVAYHPELGVIIVVLPRSSGLVERGIRQKKERIDVGSDARSQHEKNK